MKNIVLIGFMGTGKTAVGRRLAGRLKMEFIDTDTEIEKATGKTVTQIFEKYGPVRFRSEENLVVEKLAKREGLVISTGGGILLNSENLKLLKNNGVLIALKAEPEVIYQRVKNKKSRPLLKGNLMGSILKLLQEREGIYNVAEFSVDTSRITQDAVVDKIHNYLLERKYF